MWFLWVQEFCILLIQSLLNIWWCNQEVTLIQSTYEVLITVLTFSVVLTWRKEYFEAALIVVHLTPSSPTPSILPVFLHGSVVDIDQLKLIMTLVGTPEPELLMKISSESVSVKYHPAQFCHTAPSCLCLCCLCVARDSPHYPVFCDHYL